MLGFIIAIINVYGGPVISFAAIVSEKGSDAWWYMTTKELLPEKYHAYASDYQKGSDTMDVWFDSGLYLKLVHSCCTFIVLSS